MSFELAKAFYKTKLVIKIPKKGEWEPHKQNIFLKKKHSVLSSIEAIIWTFLKVHSFSSCFNQAGCCERAVHLFLIRKKQEKYNFENVVQIIFCFWLITNINLCIRIDLQWNKNLVLSYLFTLTILIILLLYTCELLFIIVWMRYSFGYLQGSSIRPLWINSWTLKHPHQFYDIHLPSNLSSIVLLYGEKKDYTIVYFHW